VDASNRTRKPTAQRLARTREDCPPYLGGPRVAIRVIPTGSDPSGARELAERIVALLSEERRDPTMAVEISLGSQEQPRSGLVDAATLAAILAVKREWVWAHAQQLGGVRLGGPRGRLRFDVARARQRIVEQNRSPAPPPPANRQRPRRRASSSPRLPPVHGAMTRLAASRARLAAKAAGGKQG
jgi:hypothetical protein